VSTRSGFQGSATNVGGQKFLHSVVDTHRTRARRYSCRCVLYIFKSENWILLGKKVVHLDDLADESCEIFRRGNFGIIACFQNVSNPNRRITICNTQLYWNEKFEFVRLLQAHYLCSQAKKFLGEVKEIPLCVADET